MGLELDPPSLPEPADLPEWHHLYATVLGSLQTIVPRIADPLANQWTKGVARVVKYLQDLDASGREFNALERDEIAALLGHRSDTLVQGREELAEAARSGPGQRRGLRALPLAQSAARRPPHAPRVGCLARADLAARRVSGTGTRRAGVAHRTWRRRRRPPDLA